MLLLLILAAAPVDRVVVHHDFYPGFMPGALGRTSLTLTLASDGGATLLFETARPLGERRRFNPTQWETDAGVQVTFSGAAVTKKSGVITATFPELTLECTPKTERVHVGGATVTPPRRCSPCYERCAELPTWTPAATHARAGLTCRLRKGEFPRGASALGERLFFSDAPGVELVSGDTDCPPEGLREPGPPAIDWKLFPEGTTGLRDVSGSLERKDGVTTRTLAIVRVGPATEVRDDARVYRTTSRTEPAATEDGTMRLGLACWFERQLVHSKDLRFDFGRDACEGQDELPKSRQPRTVEALRCFELRDGRWDEEPLVFVPNGFVERLDLDADCTKRRAVRALTSFDDAAWPVR